MPKRNLSDAPPGYKSDPSQGAMLRFQNSLPKLPVPPLQETMAKYLKSVRPLLSDSEFDKTAAAVKEFQKPGGMGEELQKRLEARAADPNIDNWLESWWNSTAYMSYRDPITFFVSYFYVHKDDKARRQPAQRAAAITTAALEFRRLVEGAELEPEYAKKQPLDMDSYKWMFNACRIPKKPEDYEQKYAATDNEHIAVVRKNKFYVFETVQNGKQLSTADLEAQFKKIYEMAGKDKGAPFGILTSENRDTWTDAREALIKAHPNNAKLLRKIESASFLVCLDDSSPVTYDESSRACWHGDGANRFADKPAQFIIFENGKAGFNGEHSCMDGTPTCRLNDFVNDVLFNNKVDHGSATVQSTLPPIQHLDLKSDATVDKALVEAQKNFDKWAGKHDLHVLAYTGYGKGVIKKYKTSPDAWIQMIIQLAYYKLWGVSKPTYESAQTRKYLHGRTEVVRTVSEESVAFVKGMEDSSVSPQAKFELFQNAIKAHVAYMGQAVNAKGVDRHLFGLKKSLKEGEDTPALFADPAFANSSHWNLSTSQLSSEFFAGYGWGEVVPDGYGIAYMIREKSLSFNIVSLGLKTQQMRYYLEEAANEIREICEAAEQPKAKL